MTYTIQQKILEAIKYDADYNKGDIIQALGNIGYLEWSSHKDWSYEDMIKWCETNYDQLVSFAILIGNYDGQVCNGGHIQYYDNGYTDGKGGVFSKRDPYIPLHHYMINLMRQYHIDQISSIKHGQKVFDIMTAFHVDIYNEREVEDYVRCDYCNGEGEIFVDEDDYRDCPECHGQGSTYETTYNDNFGSVINTDQLSDLDDRYYEIDKEFMETLNSWFIKQINLIDK